MSNSRSFADASPIDHTNAVLPRKAALASWIGSAVEYYDFFIYGTAAALVFSKIFFPAFDSTTSTVAAFATFGVAYIARPFGAVILGHIGDRYGRKKVLIITLLLMGVSTFSIGLLPTYEQIGITSSILLVLLRILQGVSAAGEQAGANVLTLEHAPPHRRAFFTSFTLSGTQAGLILATLVFLPISALPEEQLLTWGWRIPFFLSAIVVLVGLMVRRTLTEAPTFNQEKKDKTTLPLLVLLREHKKNLLRVILGAQVSVVSTIVSVFTLSYAVNSMHIARTTMLLVLIFANFIALMAIPLFAALSDRIGRKPVFIFGAFGSGCLIWPYLWCISTTDIPLIFTFGLLLSGVVYSAANGVWPSLYGEMFDTRVRLSGMAIGTQIGFALGGFAPSISAAIFQPGAYGWMPVAAFVSITTLVSLVSVATARETYRVPMNELGKQ